MIKSVDYGVLRIVLEYLFEIKNWDDVTFIGIQPGSVHIDEYVKSDEGKLIVGMDGGIGTKTTRIPIVY